MADLAETSSHVGAILIGLKQLSEFEIKYHIPQRATNGYYLHLSRI